jgi:hypothetical protein
MVIFQYKWSFTYIPSKSMVHLSSSLCKRPFTRPGLSWCPKIQCHFQPLLVEKESDIFSCFQCSITIQSCKILAVAHRFHLFRYHDIQALHICRAAATLIKVFLGKLWHRFALDLKESTCCICLTGLVGKKLFCWILKRYHPAIKRGLLENSHI